MSVGDRAVLVTDLRALLTRPGHFRCLGTLLMAAVHDDVYEVERLVDVRSRKKRTQYLVRWVGWAPEHDSWVDEASIHTPELIVRFMEGDEDFEVESILAERRSAAGESEFLVRWLASENESWEDSWEPESGVDASLVTGFRAQAETSAPAAAPASAAASASAPASAAAAAAATSDVASVASTASGYSTP